MIQKVLLVRPFMHPRRNTLIGITLMLACNHRRFLGSRTSYEAKTYDCKDCDL